MASPKSCAILGHNPMRFAWGFDEEAAECHDMKMELAQQIMVLRQQGVTHFSVACDYGVGLYAAEIINALRNDDSELMLFCITPYEEQATKWTPALRERYFDMLIKCTHMTAVSLHKQPDAQLEAYRAIIRQSDMVLAVYDPASARGDDADKAIAYARELGKPILTIHPDTLKIEYGALLAMYSPASIRLAMDSRWFCEMDLDSSCAMAANVLSSISSAIASVLTPSSSNCTPTPSSLNFRV